MQYFLSASSVISPFATSRIFLTFLYYYQKLSLTIYKLWNGHMTTLKGVTSTSYAKYFQPTEYHQEYTILHIFS